jgi:hypothetical protein
MHAPVWQAWGVLESRYNCGFIDDGNGEGISSKTTSGITPRDVASEALSKDRKMKNKDARGRVNCSINLIKL